MEFEFLRPNITEVENNCWKTEEHDHKHWAKTFLGNESYKAKFSKSFETNPKIGKLKHFRSAWLTTDFTFDKLRSWSLQKRTLKREEKGTLAYQ